MFSYVSLAHFICDLSDICGDERERSNVLRETVGDGSFGFWSSYFVDHREKIDSSAFHLTRGVASCS